MNTMILTWKDIFVQEKKILIDILIKVSKARLKNIIFPSQHLVFNAFRMTPFHTIKVVIIGQDPYYKPNQADGLAFSVQPNCIIPPSLRNIYTEIIIDLGLSKNHFSHGCLSNWAKQGILLLNNILTVEYNKPRSHLFLGWEKFTNRIIYYINKYLHKVIFILWGGDAKKKMHFIDQKKHYVLHSSHPSPLSAYISFFGCKHFSQANKLLLYHKKKIIYW